jgi:nucleotide-binding universal stress UspA family protein
MKIKPNRNPGGGGVVVELGPAERELPGVQAESKAPSPFTLKRILVPIDFSDCSKKALRYAVALAKQFGARLHLVYVGQGYYLAPELGTLDMSAAETGEKSATAGKLAALATEEVSPRIPVDVSVRNGHTGTEIVRAASETEADLIVISTHGYTGLKHVWFGSVAENVVRHAHCPVLVVREKEHEFLS